MIKCTAPTSTKLDAVGALYALHLGEREALTLCVECPNTLLLTDDTAARLAAKTLAIDAHGTLGLLIRAIRRHQMTQGRCTQPTAGHPGANQPAHTPSIAGRSGGARNRKRRARADRATILSRNPRTEQVTLRSRAQFREKWVS